MVEFLKQRKTIIIVVLGIIILGGYYLFDLNSGYNEEEIQKNMLIVSGNTDEESDKKSEDLDVIVVHITGAVKTPGVVKINEGSRIEDVIEAAGGLTEDADISNVNLAYIVEDGIKIRIPSLNDEADNGQNYITEDSGEGIVISDEATSNSSALININTASQTELETLNGIGPSIASRIITYREENGKFKTIEDIKNVTGIGESKYENIKDFITVK